MTKITELVSQAELSVLLQKSDARGWLAVATDWLLISGAMFVAAKWPSILTIVGAMILIGARQLGLAVLSHECAHRSLFRTRWLNDVAGTWLCAGPVWTDVARYREEHLRHHSFTGTESDPDLGLVTPFPTTPWSLRRKFMRDLTGISGLRRMAALLAMDLGLLTYSASVNQQRRDPGSIPQMLSHAAPLLAPMILTNGALFAALWWVGQPWLFLLWVGSYLTTHSLVLRIRSIAEHAVTQGGPDPFLNTRTTHANPLARLLLAPHRVNYHLEHHLLMTVPYFRLPALHALLRERGALNEGNTAPGYGPVLAAATRIQRPESER